LHLSPLYKLRYIDVTQNRRKDPLPLPFCPFAEAPPAHLNILRSFDSGKNSGVVLLLMAGPVSENNVCRFILSSFLHPSFGLFPRLLPPPPFTVTFLYPSLLSPPYISITLHATPPRRILNILGCFLSPSTPLLFPLPPSF